MTEASHKEGEIKITLPDGSTITVSAKQAARFWPEVREIIFSADGSSRIVMADKKETFLTSVQRTTETKGDSKTQAPPPEYGVCDSPQQFAKKYDKFSGYVTFTVVRRKAQSKEGGWRWHKWGEYVGDHQDIVSATEYLYDAKEIDEQYLFNTKSGGTGVLGLDAPVLYRLKEGTLKRFKEYAIHPGYVLPFKEAWLATTKIDEKMITEFCKSTRRSEEDIAYFIDRWNGLCGKSPIIFMQTMGTFGAPEFMERGVKFRGCDSRIFARSIDFFLHIHNVEQYTHTPNQSLNKILRVYAKGKHDKPPMSPIEFFYSLTEAEQMTVIDGINDYQYSE